MKLFEVALDLFNVMKYKQCLIRVFKAQNQAFLRIFSNHPGKFSEKSESVGRGRDTTWLVRAALGAYLSHFCCN